jgi:hypothetical protein
MGIDRILDVREDEVKREIELVRCGRNHLELVHCYLERQEAQESYALWLDDAGKERFRLGKKYCINQHTVLEPDKKYRLAAGQFLTRVPDSSASGIDIMNLPRLFLSAGDNRYLVIRNLADTPAKKVFLCVDTFAKNSFVVLKVKSKQSGHFARFQRAVSLLSRVISNYLPQLRDLGKIRLDKEEYQYQCFEYFKGIPLSKKLPLATSQAVKLFHQLALAVAELHQAGLVHRNLIPDHILVDENDQIKLVGLSVISRQPGKDKSEDLTFTIGFAQTPALTEEAMAVTFAQELVGDYSYVPTNISNYKDKDIAAVVFLFLYSLLDKTRRATWHKLLQEPAQLTRELPKYYPHDLPSRLQTLLTETVQKILTNQPLSLGKVIERFEQALGYTAAGITRFDQYPVPEAKDIVIHGTEVAVWYQPQEEVGGDFYDVVPVGNNKHGILVGDTMGHGLRACLYTQLIHPIAYLFADQRLNPTEILEKMDALLYKSKRTLQGAFATACYGILSLAASSRYFMYSSAGHPSPLLCRNGQVKSLGLEDSIFVGTKLGIGPKRFTTIENFVRLESGDCLVFYTDGIIEEQNSCGEPYQERLVACLQANSTCTAQEIVDVVKVDLQKFCNKESFDDDVTMLVLRIM